MSAGTAPDLNLYFSDYFKVSRRTIEQYGAFNISLLADLPLFIDPFLLFNSKKAAYRELHDRMIEYLRFLRDKVKDGPLPNGLIDAWFRFPEVKQNWLGFARASNDGRGLGKDFANALHQNLHTVFKNFGNEKITRASHLEKLCLVKAGVGRDFVSDFTCNLIKEYLLEYTQTFAQKHLDRTLRRTISITKVRFNYDTEAWEAATFDLPRFRKDYVLLTPVDMLTKEDTWINATDLVNQFEAIPEAMPNEQLRAQINNYFRKMLPQDPKAADRAKAAAETIRQFPELIDYYIKFKEDHGEQAISVSHERVEFSKHVYLDQLSTLARLLRQETNFYDLTGATHAEARQRIQFLRDVIENKGGHRLFYVNGEPLQREEDVHIMFRLTWMGTTTDVSREVNDGRGPADFKISKGSTDKTIVEFKLAKNPQLKRNLQKQAELYKKASDAQYTLKVIVYFTEEERQKIERILQELRLTGSKDIILIDARNDNKPSGSKA
jgi:hypothetical protein